jgi:hypothetical protein
MIVPFIALLVVLVLIGAIFAFAAKKKKSGEKLGERK